MCCSYVPTNHLSQVYLLDELDTSIVGTIFSYSLLTKLYLLANFDEISGRYFRVTPGGTEWLAETISGGSFSMARASRHLNGCGYLDSFPPKDASVRQSMDVQLIM
jgi:hypothetical protein